jgi:hypothetical protein
MGSRQSLIISLMMSLAMVACSGSGSGGTGGGSGGGSGGGTGGAHAGGMGGAGGNAGGHAGGTAGSGGSGGNAGGTAGSGGSAGSNADGGTPGGSSCATAPTLTLGGTPGYDQIAVAGDKKYFKYAVTQGDFLVAYTVANPNDDMNALDTAITVLDSAGATTLASDDDAFPRASTDSELFYNVATTGTICVKVEDWSTWAMMAPVAKPGYPFTLTVTKLSTTAMGSNKASGTAHDATSAQAGTLTSGGGALVFGVLGATAPDVFKFTAPAMAAALDIGLQPLGNPNLATAAGNGYGSTVERISVKVTNAAGTTVLGAYEPPTGNLDKSSASITVPVVAGTDYLVWIQRPMGTSAGANDFYISKMGFGADNPAEPAGNHDTPATAAPLTFAMNSAFVLGTLTLPTTNPVDYYSFTPDGGHFELVCGALRNGSGLVGATFELDGPDGGALQSETENAVNDVSWCIGAGASADCANASKTPVSLAAPGPYYFKVTATSQSSTNTGNFYRCGMFLTP